MSLEREIRTREVKERAEGIANIQANLGNSPAFGIVHVEDPVLKEILVQESPNLAWAASFVATPPFPELEKLNLNQSIRKTFKTIGIISTHELLTKTEENLLKVKGMNPKRLQELIGTLYDAGVRVKEPEELKATESSGAPVQEFSGRLDSFTEGARRALQLSKEEAIRFNHNYIGTEHILIGIIREKGDACEILARLGVETGKARSAVEFIIGRGDRPVLGEMEFTPRGKKVLELAVDEARRFYKPGERQSINTGFLLLGLIREGEGIAAGVLESLGVNLERARPAVHQFIRNQNPPTA